MLMPGAILGVRIMKQVVGQRAPNVMYKDPASGRLLAITSQPRVLLRWTVQKYPLQVQLQKSPTALTALLFQNWWKRTPDGLLGSSCLRPPFCNP